MDKGMMPIKSIEQGESYPAGKEVCSEKVCHGVTEVKLKELEWKTKTRGLLKGTVTCFSIFSCAHLVTVHVAAPAARYRKPQVTYLVISSDFQLVFLLQKTQRE